MRKSLYNNRGLIWLWIMAAIGCFVGWTAERASTHITVAIYLIVLFVILVFIAINKGRENE